MMEEYWKALLRGMTPDSKSDVHMLWIAPLAMFLGLIILSVIV